MLINNKEKVLYGHKICSTHVKSTFLKMCARNQKEFDGTKKKNLIGSWFVNLKRGQAQLNVRIVKVFSYGCDVRRVVLARFAARLDASDLIAIEEARR
jgi:hypothetical protein